MVSFFARSVAPLFRRAPSVSGAVRWTVVSVTVFFGLVSLTRAVPPQHETLKLNALSVAAASGDDPQAARLFDRDTTTGYRPAAAQQVVAALDAPAKLHTIKIYGPAAYSLSVQAKVGAAWQPVAGLQQIDLAGLSDAWHTFALAKPVTAAQLRLDLTPVAEAAPGGLKEIEIHGAADRTHIASAQQLLDALASKTPPLQARLYPAAQPQGVIGADGRGADEPGDNRFTLHIDRSPADFKRAYLVHETRGLSHWSAGSRAINGNAAQGDWLLPRSEAWATQIEEINPAWLVQGGNRIDFGAGPSGFYAVRNVRVMVEMEDGTNFVQRLAASRGAPAPAYDGDTATGWAPYAAGHAVNGVATLEAHFDKPTQVAGLKLNLAGSLDGHVSIAFLSNGAWTEPGNTGLNAAALAGGWNHLDYPSAVPVDGVRLSFQGGAGATAQVREIRVWGSGVGPRAGPPALHLGYPDNGQFVGRQAYIRGFVTPVDNGSGPARLHVGGQEVAHTDGAFGLPIGKDDVGLDAQADRDPWTVDVTAAYPDGAQVRQRVSLRRYSEPPVVTGKDGLSTLQARVPPGKARKLAYGGAELQIGADALDQAVTFGITPLRGQDLARLDAGTTNVTKGPPQGYRFTPHGARFKNKIKVVLPFDRAAIPPGHTEQDVRTYYFDDQAGTWKVLERAQVDAQQGVIVSYTDHFTDMINATITVPDHPNPASLNPTSIKDIKAADPGAQINLIEPPKASNMGDARLTYPIELPPGRAGMQPGLAVQYNSGGGNGWMGLGWDIAMQSVGIDTRWGVPRYDGVLETESYVLDGEPLTPVAHRGELRPRTPEKTFHTRTEGQFRRIVRHGSAPAGYWWEVTDKSGMRYFYGGRPEGGQDKNAVLADPANGNVFRWALKEVRDTNGNTIVYQYDIVNGGGAGGEPWRQIYLKRIHYTGSQGALGPYEVVFQRAGGRTDVVVDGRAGFKTVMDQRLVGIDVNLGSQTNLLIRRYRFDYVTGKFSKTLLARVTQFGEDGKTEFNHHEFDYFDEVATGEERVLNGFEARQSFAGASTVSGEQLLSGKRSTAFGGQSSENDQGHLYTGVAFGYRKEVSIGVKVGSDSSQTKTLLALVDINGDSLPDQVYQSGGRISYRRNLGGPAKAPNFGREVAIPTLSRIGEDSASTTTYGAQAYYGASFAADKSRTRSRGHVYITDGNGDGLPDVVINGTVYFNRLVAGEPTFGTESPTPLGASAKADASGLVENPNEDRAEIEAIYHLLDPIRRWVAPYAGTVSISGNVRLLKAPDADYRTADGVRLSIQHNGGELWNTTLSDPRDLGAKPITGLAAVRVNAGDRLYLRANSINDGAFDAVQFDPVVQYLNVDAAQTDENAMPLFRYQPGADFAYGGIARPWVAPFAGAATVGGEFVKSRATSDDIRIELLKNGRLLGSQTVAGEFTGSVPVNLAVETVEGDQVLVRIFADSRIDLTGIVFAPRVVYTAVSGATELADENGNPLYAFDAPTAAQIYPRNLSTTPYRPWVAAAEGMLHVSQTVRLKSAPPSDYATQVTLAVKRAGLRLAKQVVQVRRGAIDGAATLTADIPVKAGDVLYFTADATASDSLDHLAIEAPKVSYGTGPGQTVPHDVHLGLEAGEAFGGGFRGWYYGEYNGSQWPAAIDESRLRHPASDKDEVYKQFLGMLAFPAQGQWRLQQRGSWIGAQSMSATRKGINYLDFSDGSDLGGARGIVRLGGGKNKAVSLSMLGFGAGRSDGGNWSDVDFIDFNGDRYPDVVGGGSVQATWPNGGLGEQRHAVGGFGRVRESESINYNLSLGATTSRTNSDSKGKVNGQTTEMAALNLSAGVSGGRGESTTGWDLIDINGDGLPDYVARGDGLSVRLNLGYRFGVRETWRGSSEVRTEKTNNIGINAGFAMPAYSFGGGIAHTISKAAADMELTDVNGDGLLDIVTKAVDKTRIESPSTALTVQFNTGNGFSPAQQFSGSMAYPIRKNATLSRNLGAYFTISIPIPFTPASVIINPGYYYGNSLGGYEVNLSDFNGDGYADHIYSDTNGNVSVALNRHGKTNLLKTIRRPLGARIAIDYQRQGNTTEQPHSQWALARSEVHDGHPGDGVDTLLTTYAYEDGYYDRAERDFYGYARVIETQRDIANGEAAYRRTVSHYHNRHYPTKGLLARTVLEDGAGRPYTETKQHYQPVTVADGAAVPGQEAYSATVFPQLTRTEQFWYEGQSGAGKQTHTTHRYDELGNVVEFFDAGDVGADDDVRATIAYTQDRANWIVGKPTSIAVEGAGRLMRRREASYAPGTGNLVQVRQFLGNGQAAVTDLAYHPNGTLQSVLGPVNHRGQRYRLDYAYDPVVATHIAGIVDSFGLSSSAAHHYKYGQVASTIDTNGNPTDYAYDQFGRTVAITGPYQSGSGEATIRFDYHPHAATPWARTRHLDVFRNAGDTIDTVLLTDGFKRVIQTKKDISLHTGATSAPLDMMSVSGRITHDAFGRSIAQYYPVTESLGNPGAFNEAVDPIAPTKTEYDVLDRATRVTLPDGTRTAMQYGFGTDRDGLTQFQTVVTDANGKQKVSYRDVNEQITAVQEFLAGQSIWTSYRYDPLKQIVQVKDDRGHLTQASYDHLGRRIALDNPDTGLTTSEYDLAGNLVAKVTARLRAQNKAIRYSYDHLRLTNVSYPDFPGNNIAYQYGPPKAPHNQAGRIVQVHDQGGGEHRFYGKLGETVKEVKTIASATQGNSSNSPEVWTTEYLFDTFGRLQRLAYPDGEILSYGYDAGGNLAFAQGQKQGQTFTYLARLEYDKFEQRQYLAYGNGATAQYRYDERNRRLANLQAATQGRTIQNLAYQYDKVGNILGLQNQVPVPPPNLMGGPTAQSFGYDDLYRLTQAAGSWDYAPNKRERYRLAMAYDSIHNITKKTQVHEVVQPGGQAIEQRKTSYDWTYEYQSTHPHAPTHLGNRTYTYDANGNQSGWDHDRNGTRRRIVWDEDNRIQSLFDNGHEQTYQYDDQGERVTKRGPQGETAYVNQWYTVRNREIASKHVYAGTTRIATALVPGAGQGNGNGQGNTDGKENNGSAPGQENGKGQGKGKGKGQGNSQDKGNSNANQGGGNGSAPITTASTTTLATGNRLPTGAQQAPGILQGTGVARRSAQAAQHARNLAKNPHYATSGTGTGTGGGTASNQDNFLYYYHPDHLGSSSYVTDAIGKPFQHLEYFPFGETWVEESSNTQRTPYLFTAKELDEETGLYYFGARYYDPRTSVWQSADPILGKYLPTGDKEKDKTLAGMGGVFNSLNLGLYSYAHLNPIKIIDPDGREAWVYVTPRKNGGFDYLAFDDKGSKALTGTFNTNTWVNTQEIRPGNYTVSPRPHLEKSFAQTVKDLFTGDRNKNEGKPTLSNTSNWNQIRYPDGTTMEGVQIHPGRTAEGGGISQGCLVCSDPEYGRLNEMFMKNYSDGGVHLIKKPGISNLDSQQNNFSRTDSGSGPSNSSQAAPYVAP